MATTFDSKFVMIHWDAANEAVTMQWKRPAQYQDFREGLSAALKQVTETKADRVVADHSILNLQDEDEAFFLKQWIPKSAQNGVKRLAVVVQRRAYVQIPKTRIMQKLKSGGLVLQYFHDMDEARVWIREARAA